MASNYSSRKEKENKQLEVIIALCVSNQKVRIDHHNERD